MLQISPKHTGDEVILQCQGAIARGEETALLCAAIRNENRNLTLDLAHVDSIDVAGIGALISLQAAGVYLKLLNPTEAVRRVLKATQLDTILEVCDEGLTAIGVSMGVSPSLATGGA